MFTQWLAENYPKLRLGSLEDDRGSNHRHGNAVDVGGLHNHPDKKKILKVALDLGLRIGKEVKGKKGVGGWSGSHYHFDDNKGNSKGIKDLHFVRGGETGHASMKDKDGNDLMNKKEAAANLKFREEMSNLKKEAPLVNTKELINTYKPRVGKYLKLINKAKGKKGIRKLQEEIGTKADGVFGKNTMRALINYVNPKKEAVKGEDVDNYVMERREQSPILDMVNNANKEEEVYQNTKYDNLSFKDAFEKAYKEKGEGEVFKWKGEDKLLKRAEPKKEIESVEESPNSFADLIKKYADMPIEESSEPLEIDEELATPEEMNYIPEEEMEQETMSDFDPREAELQRLIKRGEELQQRKVFKDGGRKYAGGDVKYEATPEEINAVDIEDEASKESTNDIKTPRVRSAAPEADMKEADADYNAAEIAPSEGPIMDVPEPKAKPMTMQDLENDYKKLMEASKNERSTAAWATAATQVASMLDKFSAVPVGIKPIQFQANQSTEDMKQLIALGKMKGLGQNNQQMTPSQRARFQLAEERLQETKEDRKRKKIQFEQSQNLREEKFKRKKEEGDRLSDKQAERIESLKFARDITSRIEEQLPDVEEFLGPYASRFESASSYVPGMEQDPKFVAFKANAVEQLASYIKDKSGAQVSDTERNFLEGALPTVTDKPGEFKSKLKEFNKRLDMVKEGRFGTAKAQGKDVSGFKELLGDKTSTKEQEFPRQIKKDGKTATVSNELQLKDAISKGWR